MKARALAICGLTMMIAGCGGRDVGSNAGTASGDASLGGIWQGHDSVSGLSLVGLIDESGDFRLIRGDRVQYVGKAHVSGNTVAGDAESFAERGTPFSDSSAHGTGSLSGTVIERRTLRIHISEQTDNGTPGNVELALTYDPFYETDSSLTAVVGRYVDAQSGTVFDVNDSGHFFARDSASGCSIDGSVSIIDAHYNVYGISYTYSSCGSDAAALDGVSATGKGSLTDIGAGAQVLAAVSYTISGQKTGLVVELNRL